MNTSAEHHGGTSNANAYGRWALVCVLAGIALWGVIVAIGRDDNTTAAAGAMVAGFFTLTGLVLAIMGRSSAWGKLVLGLIVLGIGGTVAVGAARWYSARRQQTHAMDIAAHAAKPAAERPLQVVTTGSTLFLPGIELEQSRDAVLLRLRNDSEQQISLLPGTARILVRTCDGHRSIPIEELTGSDGLVLRPGDTSDAFQIAPTTEQTCEEGVYVRFEYFDGWGTYGTDKRLMLE